MKRSLEQSFYRNAYFLLQQLRGRPVGRYIGHLQARERLERDAFERLITTELAAMLRYARATVPWYASGEWGRRITPSAAVQLQSWPVLDRHTIRAHGRELLARTSALGLFYRNSSASTGEPVRVAWSPRAAAWGWANEYRAMLWHGVPAGARTLLMWGSRHRLVQDGMRNCRGFSTRELTTERLEQAARYLLDHRPDMCMGLPSALTALADHVRARHPEAPRSLVPVAKVGGEQVFPFQRDYLATRLGARVVEFYGCTEVGPIAAQCPQGSLHIMSDNVYVEICRNDEPVRAGEFGDIVVTAMRNRAMPLIRCKIGDSGRISPEPCRCGRPQPVLAELVGRAADLLVAADGTKVHGSVLGAALQSLVAQLPAGVLRQVLFQQLDTLHWKILVESDGADATLDARLTQLVRGTFGAPCQVRIERVATIPRESSGKFRYYRTADRPDARSQDSRARRRAS